MPTISITYDLYKRIEARALAEEIPVSKLVEKLLVEATDDKTIQIFPFQVLARS